MDASEKFLGWVARRSKGQPAVRALVAAALGEAEGAAV